MMIISKLTIALFVTKSQDLLEVNPCVILVLLSFIFLKILNCLDSTQDLLRAALKHFIILEQLLVHFFILKAFQHAKSINQVILREMSQHFGIAKLRFINFFMLLHLFNQNFSNGLYWIIFVF